ncbi:MAG: hypothetical protein ACXWQJ_16325, partial [Bdellovibrionota bacterium]
MIIIAKGLLQFALANGLFLYILSLLTPRCILLGDGWAAFPNEEFTMKTFFTALTLLCFSLQAHAANYCDKNG